jgi:hypothetical protein
MKTNDQHHLSKVENPNLLVEPEADSVYLLGALAFIHRE